MLDSLFPEHNQNKRSIRLSTTLGDKALMVSSAHLQESMSAPFHYELNVFSDKEHDLKAKGLIGTPASLLLILQENKQHYRHGYITEFTKVGTERNGDITRYRLTIEPWLALLKEAYDCRIYQNKTVKEVIAQLFEGLELAAFNSDQVIDTHQQREYWVQHNETRLDFFHRICRLEGLAYYFQHGENEHVLKLVDQAKALPLLAKPNPLLLQATTHGHEHLKDWQRNQQFVVGKTSMRSYNHQIPKESLESSAKVSGELAGVPRVNDIESYQYTESYDTHKEGRAESGRVSHHQAQARHNRWVGSGDYRHLEVGRKFTIEKVPKPLNDDSQGYILTDLAITIDEDKGLNHVDLQASTDDVLVFPDGGTRKRMLGVETATVTGPKGEEIHTNEYGQIKVQFHWDRDGVYDENTTCWLRVMNAMAGPGFGDHYTPRIGQEVVVAFENGNPDKPFVLGSLYHHLHKPPFAEDKGRRAGFRSHSTLKGGTDNFNELSFFDKKGSEEVFLQAEKDLKANIKNDQNAKIGHNKSQHVGNNQSNKVGKNYTINVGETLTVEAGKKIRFQVGSSTVTLTNGKVDISGAVVDIHGDIKLN